MQLEIIESFDSSSDPKPIVSCNDFFPVMSLECSASVLSVSSRQTSKQRDRFNRKKMTDIAQWDFILFPSIVWRLGLFTFCCQRAWCVTLSKKTRTDDENYHRCCLLYADDTILHGWTNIWKSSLLLKRDAIIVPSVRHLRIWETKYFGYV